MNKSVFLCLIVKQKGTPSQNFSHLRINNKELQMWKQYFCLCCKTTHLRRWGRLSKLRQKNLTWEATVWRWHKFLLQIGEDHTNWLWFAMALYLWTLLIILQRFFKYIIFKGNQKIFNLWNVYHYQCQICP